ncbi:TMS membrane protein/tumor differentially expressed protein [Clavulina sp. PMI_390]|nr:TMS membrane protein/tumor differentially expressed protein [Clavulina sp. PMI_390]
MGLLLSLPFGGLAASCLTGIAFCFTSTAASLFFKSCNCNSSIATRVGFAIIFLLNSMLAWIMNSDWAIKLLEKWSYDYIKMDCTGGKCYGVLAVHRICFALTLFHAVLAASLVGVKNTKAKRAAIQNGWWGPKVLAWLVLVIISFFIPNGFFMFWGNYISVIGATIFILIGLVLLVDFAHSWSETCLRNWEETDSGIWQFILIGSSLGLYAVSIAMTGVLYAFFAGSGCTINRFFISFNLALGIVITVMSIHPVIQDANPRSGLSQASMVVAYCTYLITSAVANHTHATCNPIHDGSGSATRNTAAVFGAAFTFLAIAYTTTRAATQSRALVGTGGKKTGALALPVDGDDHEIGVISSQPSRKDSPRYQAILAAVEAGAIPASALDEDFDEDEDDSLGEERDDEKNVVRYNYTWFHVIFLMGAMYVAMLLTDWSVAAALSRNPIIAGSSKATEDPDVYIGRSEVAMWIRVVSSWMCMLLYMWSLLAPALFPDR